MADADFVGWYGWTVALSLALLSFRVRFLIEVATAEGRLFFFHEERRISQWHQPTELEPILGVWKQVRQCSHIL